MNQMQTMQQHINTDINTLIIAPSKGTNRGKNVVFIFIKNVIKYFFRLKIL